MSERDYVVAGVIHELCTEFRKALKKAEETHKAMPKEDKKEKAK
jgi:hypothetical protein